MITGNKQIKHLIKCGLALIVESVIIQSDTTRAVKNTLTTFTQVSYLRTSYNFEI